MKIKKNTSLIKRTTVVFLVAAAVLLQTAKSESAIDLVTVPTRDTVQLTIYNSADITLVRETRTLTFKKGLNTIQFAWAGTLIDPTSLRLRFKTGKRDLDLLDTTYPPRRTDALQWNVDSRMSGSAKVEISYFTSGITWKADYVGITGAHEKHMDIKGYVKVINNSGEDYPNAKVRLVVGTINLVEKISDLAQKPVSYRKASAPKRAKYRRRFKGYIGKAEAMEKTANGDSFREKKIIKEGLSEYFIFTIEGRESIPTGWQKRLNSVYVENVPVETIYRYSDVKYRGKMMKFYEFKNQKQPGKKGKGQLGESPLPDGYFRVFSRNSSNDLTFRASVHVKYVATGDKVKLSLGESKDVMIERRLKDFRKERIKVVMNYYKKPYVKNYYEHYFYETKITNTLKRSVKVEVERRFSGKYKVEKLKFKTYRVDNYTLKYYPDLPSSARKNFAYEVLVFKGTK